jgi:YfiH family protein
MNQLKWKDGTGNMQETVQDGVVLLKFPGLEQTGLVRQGFSTRIGGVSEGHLGTMNVSFARGDREEAVQENLRRIGACLHVTRSHMVFSRQTHTTNVRLVTEEDCGKGVTRPLDYNDVDGLITDVPGICLVTMYADCVPLYFVDPVHRAIGLSHSGWRGTVNRMGEATVRRMRECFGTRPEDLLAAIGPSICQDCYEVTEDVIDAFRKQFDPKHWEKLFYQTDAEHYQLNLWRANEIVLQEAGIPAEQIETAGLCTCCNSELLFSHRASGGKRGNLGAFLVLNDNSR